jgi:hypothetical protein
MIFLLNGPPRSGKDTAGRFIMFMLQDAYYYKMSRPLKRAVQAIYGFNDQVFRLLEDSKDEKTNFLYGITYRQAQIAVFAGLELRHNSRILSDIAIDAITHGVIHSHTVITDCGMTPEAQHLVDHFGKKKVCLIKLERPGCDFEHDIREYVDINCTLQETINNEHNLDIFEAQVRKVLRQWDIKGLVNEGD